MKYLSLHETELDYNNLVLDETNIPHVSMIIKNKQISFISPIRIIKN